MIITRAVISLAIAAASLLVLPVATVSAQPVAQKVEITITAIVPHMHTVIIDGQGDIVQIISNTEQDARPRVFLNIVSATSERPVSETVLAAYREQVPTGSSRIGVLYQRPLLPLLSSSPDMPPALIKLE